jgi:hypothetical protein
VILTEVLDKVVPFAGRCEVYGAQCRKHKEPAEKVQHGPVRDRHLSHLRVVDHAIIVKNVEIIRDLSPKVHCRNLSLTRKNVSRHKGAISATLKA